MSSLLIDKIYNYCFRLLGLKPYTESDLRQKIRGRFKEIKRETLEEIIQKLKELNYLNDQVFAENYIEYRTKLSPRGNFLLKQELLRKGINADLIQKSIETINPNEIELAQQLAEHKAKSLQSFEPQKKKEKLIRFLQSRGFSYDVIKKVL